MGHIEENFHSIWRGRFGDRAVGHDHFWDRALSRRQFFGAAFAGGAALSVPGLAGVGAETSSGSALPRRIKGGTHLGPFFKHFYFPTLINPVGATKVVDDGSGDGATFRDFDGVIGVSEFPPTGAATDPFFGGMFWAADIRFMEGQYVGRDSVKHHGAVAFV